MSDLVKKEASINEAILRVVERKDIDPERLEAFLDLQYKMEARQAQKAFFAAMASFQGDCPIIPKTKKVDFTSKTGNKTQYDYSPLDEIIYHIKPVLVKNGLSYSFDIKKTNSDAQMELVTTIRHREGYSESSSYFFTPLHDDQRMNMSQRAKSAITYAKRSALENALGIVTQNEDDDALRAIDKEVSEKQMEQIKNLLQQTGTEEDKFCKFLKVSDLKDLSDLEAKKAIHALKQKRAKK